MTDSNDRLDRALMQRIARRAMIQRGLLPGFTPQALVEFVTSVDRPVLRTVGLDPIAARTPMAYSVYA